MIGSTILHYKIIKKLGEGGMGIVYLAEDLNLERKVAIKFMPHPISLNSDEIERFKVEAKAAASLNHPDITTIHAIEESEDQTFIVMEYINGVELSEKIRTGGISIAEAVNISIQIAEGLEAAHKKGIVHRDIKSQNIMITAEGKVKIMDFGLARIGKDTQVTKVGAASGTLTYMAPEQIRGADADARSDIFSFGVVMYEMFTRHLPFEGEYEASILHLILNEQPEPMGKYKSDLPPGLCEIISRTLEKNPDDRYQSVSEVLADLYRLQEHKAKDSGSEEKELDHYKPFKNSKIIFTLAAFAVFALFLIGYFFFYNDNEPDLPASANHMKSLAVMYFENLSDPDDTHHIAEMLTNLLITSLSQVDGLEVISREQLYRILEDLDVADNKILSRKTAIRVAQNAGVSIILVGSLLEDTPSLAVTVKMIDVKSGNILGSQRLAGFETNQIFTFVDSLALLVRNDLKIAGSDFSESKPVADVTTDSPEAYRAYVEGINYGDKLYLRESLESFAKAIELDSNFAMAYYYLAQAVHDPVESRDIIKKAVELADSVTDRERLLIYAINYEWQAKRKQAAEIYRQIIEKYPHETEAYNQLALISDISINILQRGVRVNPSAKILWDNLAISYATNDQKQEALDAINEYIKLAPAEPNPYDSKGEIYGLYMQYDSSEIYYKKALAFRKDFWNVAMKLGNYYVLRSNYDEAQKYFNMSGHPGLKYPSLNVHRGLLNSEITRLESTLKTITDVLDVACTRAILINLYYETGHFSRMLQLAKVSTEDWQKIFPHDHYGRSLLVWALVKNNRLAEAEKIIADLENNNAENYPWVSIFGLYASAVLSYEKGDYEIALEKFNKTFSKLKPRHEPNIFQAVCLLKTGRIKEAKAKFEIIKNWPMTDLSYQILFVPGDRFYGYINNVKAHYWLGIAYEKLGENDKASKEYKVFLDTWKDADFNSPELGDAKIRLANLEQ